MPSSRARLVIGWIAIAISTLFASLNDRELLWRGCARVVQVSGEEEEDIPDFG
jgi:hypothetical protein